MARKTRKKSVSKAKKKPTEVSMKKRKPVAKKKSKAAARKKAARKTKPKPKGVVATIVADIEAVVDTLTEAERLHRKLEPHVSREPE